MTANEFVIWLKGFTVACNDFHPTPAQWDKIREELGKVGQPFPINGAINNNGSLSFTNLPHRTDITYTTKQQLND